METLKLIGLKFKEVTGLNYGVEYGFNISVECREQVEEEFLRRLAGFRYTENFILKGGLFIYILTNFGSHATVNVDFLMRGLNNDLARMDEIITEILAVVKPFPETLGRTCVFCKETFVTNNSKYLWFSCQNCRQCELIDEVSNIMWEKMLPAFMCEYHKLFILSRNILW